MGDGNYAMMAHFMVVSNYPITLQKNEVESGNFYPIEKIDKLISKNTPFTPAFLHFFSKHTVGTKHYINITFY